jgi:hypothetical protein
VKKNLNSGITPIRIFNDKSKIKNPSNINQIVNKKNNGNSKGVDNNPQMSSTRASILSSRTIRIKSCSSINYKAPKFTLGNKIIIFG